MLKHAVKMDKVVKETASRDFRPLFFHKSILPWPPSNSSKLFFELCFKFAGDIREYMLCYTARSHDSAL
jgi:hypothetical protein